MKNLQRKIMDPSSILFNDYLLFPYQFNVSPAVNMCENPESFSLEISAPGYPKDKFKIEAENGIITISNKVEKKSTNERDGSYTRREFKSESFSRSFRLPDGIDSDKISASYENGILIISIPKMMKSKNSKLIEIQ